MGRQLISGPAALPAGLIASRRSRRGDYRRGGSLENDAVVLAKHHSITGGAMNTILPSKVML